MAVILVTELVERLSATIGDAKAREAVEAAAQALGAGGIAALDQHRTLELLDLIAKQDGVTGLAARLLRIRAEFAFDKLVSGK